MAVPFSSSPPTVGLEIELQLVDVHSHALRDEVLELVAGFPGDEHVKPEMLQSGFEVTTSPAVNVGALREELRERLGAVSRRCADLGVRLVGGGVHPFSAGLSSVTPMPRYIEAAEVGGYLSSRLQCTFGQHVHVGMPSAEACMRVFGRLRGALSPLLALSGASALWEGRDTRFTSFRHRLLGGARNYGVPPALTSVEDLERLFATARRAGVAETYRDVHWDLRARPDFGTLEVRVLDAQPTVSSALALGAFVHALAVQILQDEEPIARWLPPALPVWIEQENAFAASRYGLAARLICDEEGAMRPARETLVGLLEAVLPAARELGSEEELEAVREIIDEGTWAERQRRLLARFDSAESVTAALADAFEEDLASTSARPQARPAHDALQPRG